jgi:hypothetical protein
MNWSDLLANRKQTFSFLDDKPEQKLINDMINEMHLHLPVKQKKILFNLLVLDNTIDLDKKYNIYSSSRVSNEKNARYNPQLLAPYLFLFFVKEDLITSTYHRYEALIQIGMASMFLSYSATNKNLSIGYCQCLDRDRLEMLYPSDIIDTVQIIIGIGYENPLDKYYCIVDKCYKAVPTPVFKKCPLDEYVKYE